MTLIHFGALCIALLLGVAVSFGILAVLAMADDRQHIRHGRIPLQPLPPEDEICLCCTSRPYTVDDCNCRTDCGQVHCQAHDPGSWRDIAITEELARMLTEGNEHP